MKKRILTIVIALALFLPFTNLLAALIIDDPPALPPEISDSDYYWSSKEYIANRSQGLSYQKQPSMVGSWLNIDGSPFLKDAYLYDFFSPTGENISEMDKLKTIAVSKANPLSGYFEDVAKNNRDGIPRVEIDIKDPFRVAPNPIKLTTRGKLAGKIIKTGEWASDFATVMKKGRISLYRQSIPEPDLVYINDKAALKLDEKGHFSIDVNSIVGGGLPDGDYVLAFYHSEKATSDGCIDCGLGWNLWGNESEYSGDVSFRLERINAYDPIKDSQDLRGYGKITLTIASDEEKKSPATTTKISEPEKGFFIEVGEGQKNTLMSAFRDALIFVSDSISFMMGTISKWINQSINESADINNQVLQNVAKNIRNISLSLLTLGLLIIAFANILNIQVEQYGLTKMIPKFVIGIVFSYFSYFIAMFLLSLMGALQALMLSFISQNGIADINFNPSQFLGITGDYTSNPLTRFLNSTSMIFQAVFFIIIMIISLIIFVWLWLIMIVRKAMLMILVAVAPLAFIAMIMPFSEKYYKQWWAAFWKWAFIGPAVMFMLLLSKLFMESWFASSFTSSGTDPANADSWIYLVVYTVFIFMAATIPLKMGNEIYDKALGYGKKGLGFAAKKTGLASMWADRKASVAQREKERGANLRSQIALSGKGTDSFWRRTVAGVDERQAKAMDSARINDMVSRMEEEDITKDVARSRYLQAEGDERRALARLQAKNGWFDDGDEAAIERFAEDFSKDAYIRNTAPKEQGDLLSAAELAGYGDYGTDDVKIGQVSSVLRGKAYSGVTDLKLSQITQMMKPENKHEMIGLLSNGQKMKKAQETWDDQRMAALGRAYRSLSMQERSTIMSSPDMTDEHRAVIERAVRLDSERTEAARGGAKGMNSVHQVKKKGTEQKVDIIDTQEPPRPTHPPGTGGGQPPADGTPPTNSAPPASNL